MTTKAALGAVVLRVPTLTDFDRDPLECIETGDWVEVDGDAGTLRVWKDSERGLRDASAYSRSG
jgi:predicted aconitase with swiveling domain